MAPLISSLLFPLLFLYSQRVAAKCYFFDDNDFGNFSQSGINSTNFGTCGYSSYYSSSYQSCCQIGDTCLEGGFCQLRGSSTLNDVSYYLAGCTDSTGDNEAACTGYCPNGFPYLQWNEDLEEWLCCPTYSSASTSLPNTCRPPQAPGFSSSTSSSSSSGSSAGAFTPTEFEWLNNGPEDLVATAVVKGVSSASAISSTLFDPFVTETSYSYPTNYYSSPTPYYGSDPYGDDPEDYGYGGLYGSPVLLAVVIVVPILVGGFIIGLLIWLCVHKNNKRNAAAAAAAASAAAAANGAAPTSGAPPNGQPVNGNGVFAAPNPQMQQVQPGSEGVVGQPAAATTVQSVPDAPVQTSSTRSAALLPPISEVGQFNKTDLGLATPPAQADGAAAASQAVAKGGEASSVEPAQVAPTEQNGHGWPLNGAAQKVVSNGNAGDVIDAAHHQEYYA